MDADLWEMCIKKYTEYLSAKAEVALARNWWNSREGRVAMHQAHAELYELEKRYCDAVKAESKRRD